MIATRNRPSNSRSLVATFIAMFIAVFVALHTGTSRATVIITTDAGQAAAFQSGATIETFDDLSALTITTYASGQTVPAGNQYSSRNLVTFTAPFFNSGGASFGDPIGNPGTRIGIFDPDGAIAGDVHSQNNVAGPLTGGTDFAFGNGFMEVIFPADMRRVGLWVTHGTFTMFLKDSTNTNLSTGDVQVTGSAGQFIGIERDTADVRGITMGFPESFTFDDFTYSATAIPEPAIISLATLAMGVLLRRRRFAIQ